MNTLAQFRCFATAVLPRVALGVLLWQASAGSAAEVADSVWGRLPDGREVRAFTLSNAQGIRVVVAEYGALLVSVETPDKEGRVGEVTLSYRSLDEALAGGVFGSVVGRFANRIGGGGFEIDGRRHELASVNKEGVHIHGGATGFHRQLWKGAIEREGGVARVVFSLTSPDGHEGYPGEVEVSVAYELTEDGVLRLDYRGRTDRATHLNLTNHAYFNLAGTGDVRGHLLRLDCGRVLGIDRRKVPTGELVPVDGTPFDFREAKPLGRDLEAVEGGGYDHCFAIDAAAGDADGKGLKVFARLSDPVSGRVLEVATTKPGVQIFTANAFSGKPFPRWGGICFETQFFPDAPNRPEFPSSLLRPGEEYRHRTEFRFGVEFEKADAAAAARAEEAKGAEEKAAKAVSAVVGGGFVPVACELVPLPGSQLSFRHQGRELTRWHFGGDTPRPFFHPFNGPSGESLTRMGHPGAQNHDHHRSVWFAHAQVDGIDFWSENTAARIRQKFWQVYEDGESESVMAARLGWYDGEGTERMEQDLVVASRPGEAGEHSLEIQITLRPGEGREAVELGRSNFGLLAVRLAKSISHHFGGGEVVSSEGGVGEEAVFGRRAAWMDYAGPVAVGTGPVRRVAVEGVAFFDHPGNPRHPTPWHVRADGWMGAAFCLEEGWTVARDTPLVLRYLLHAHRGAADPARNAELAAAFADRPGFVVEKSSRPHRQFQVRSAGSGPESE